MSGEPDRDEQVSRAEIDAIKGRVEIEDVARAYVPRLVRRGRMLVGLSPFKSERTPSFYVYPHQGSFYCYATQRGGSVIDLVAGVEGISVGAAIKKLKADAGVMSDPAERARRAQAHRDRAARADEQDRKAKARRQADAIEIWVRAIEAADAGIVQVYLEHRRVDCDAIERVYGVPVPASLRAVLDLPYWVADGPGGWQIAHTGPAMVGRLSVAPGGPMTGLHRTWLRDDGRGKLDSDGLNAKLTLGHVGGSGGWLFAGDGADADHLIVGEGYETTLSMVSALAQAGRGPFWVASGVALGNLAGNGVGRGSPHPDGSGRHLPSERPDPDRPGIVPPAGIRRVTLLADADGRDRAMTDALVRRAAAKFRLRGCHVRTAWPDAGTDFNDMIAAGRSGVRDALRAVDQAEVSP